MSESDEHWDTPEFTKVRQLVDVFMKGKSIANATHGEYMAKEFCQWMKSHDPMLYASCEEMQSIYYIALLDWHMDQH